jgi:hypothetical protein
VLRVPGNGRRVGAVDHGKEILEDEDAAALFGDGSGRVGAAVSLSFT